MGHTIGDAIIVVALAAALFGYFYLNHLERRRRLEIIHQERLTAMDKGIPWPELPIDPPRVEKRPDPHVPLILGEDCGYRYGRGPLAHLDVKKQGKIVGSNDEFPIRRKRMAQCREACARQFAGVAVC